MPRRVVVIGAGHNGLVAAIRLATLGHSVLVLEGAPQPGGGLKSAELTLPGFVHDTCSAFFPLTAASPAFRKLPLERHGLEWVNPELAMVHVLDGGAEIALHRDLGATAASLDACAPGAGHSWRELTETLWPRREALIRAVLGRFPPLGAAAALLGSLRSRTLELAPMAIASAATLGWGLFGDDRAAGWLAGSAAHADVSSHAPGSGAFGLGLNFLGHVVGWPYPRGGAGRLTAALESLLRSLGAELRCAAPVERIEVHRRRVSRLRLRGGETAEADAVLCTVSPRPFMQMLADGALPARVSRRLHGWRYGLGTLKLDYALSEPVPWLGEAARRTGVVHVGGPLEEVAGSLAESAAGRFPERPALVVGQHSLGDPLRAPEGKHTLYVYSRVPQRPDLSEDEMVTRVEAQLERYAPGFREVVLGRAVRTPDSIERENPSMCGGDLASGSFELDQQLLFRPDPRLCRYRTPIRGLYVAGAWVHPGAGVHGMSGHEAASVLNADARRRRV